MLIAACAALVVQAAGNEALGVDLHELWDSRCAECHGHAGEFARKYLEVQDGELIGRHPVRDVRLFLDNHYPPAGQVQAIYEMLLTRAAGTPRFQQQCGQCHGRASDFVREFVAWRDGTIYGRESGMTIAEFLASHRDLGSADVAFFTRLLDRIALEIGASGP